MKRSELSDELRYKLLKSIESDPKISQRQLASQMGLSLGKVNYCIKALVDVGYVKLQNFTQSQNKLGYCYNLTPKGISEKSSVTMRFLKSKQDQYEALKVEIEVLRKEAEVSPKAVEKTLLKMKNKK
ncbi:MAG: MarR family EPS-associated transcriptional regulator [Alteromonadaceae bacterium]|nr:MAG: MarR family EPS-associated transcriptional regulator [Alteromonadaceae bacterium]